MGFEPQTDVHIAIIPVDKHLEGQPTAIEAALLVCPDNANFRLELLGVGFMCVVVPVDNCAALPTVDIEFVDDSASDAVANLTAGFDLNACVTARVYNPIFRGSQILEPGDTINAEHAAACCITTAGQGCAFVVEYRVLHRS